MHFAILDHTWGGEGRSCHPHTISFLYSKYLTKFMKNYLPWKSQVTWKANG